MLLKNNVAVYPDIILNRFWSKLSNFSNTYYSKNTQELESKGLINQHIFPMRHFKVVIQAFSKYLDGNCKQGTRQLLLPTIISLIHILSNKNLDSDVAGTISAFQF